MRTKSLFMVFVLAALSLLIGVQTAQAQVAVQEQQIMSKTGGYFQLAEGTGDSTLTTGLDLTYTYLVAPSNVAATQYPDRVNEKWNTSADSTVNVKLAIKVRYTAGVNAYITNAVFDSVYSASAAATKGFDKITRSTYTAGTLKGFGISVIAKKTGGAQTNAIIAANATKVWITLVCYYTLK